MNSYILVSKQAKNSGDMILIYAPVVRFNKDFGSGIFISQNNRISQIVTQEVFNKAILGEIKEVSYSFK